VIEAIERYEEAKKAGDPAPGMDVDA